MGLTAKERQRDLISLKVIAATKDLNEVQWLLSAPIAGATTDEATALRIRARLLEIKVQAVIAAYNRQLEMLNAV